MKYHELNVVASKGRKRVGRGIGSGHGKTAGRGTKGQNARTGGGVRPGFEGGQNPLMKRLPKVRGFKPQTKPLSVVHTDQLNNFKANAKVDKQKLKEAGIIKRADQPVKLLMRGKIEKALTVSVEHASKTAVAAIEAAGGTYEKAT